MKRPNTSTISQNKAKKQKFELGYHSASSVHNYILNDPVLDYIKHRSANFPRQRSFSQESESLESQPLTLSQPINFKDFITRKGCEFEENVVKLLQSKLTSTKKIRKLGLTIIRISNGIDDIYSIKKYQETLDAINNQVAIIYQGVLHGNDHFRFFGSPDLLIRSDVVKYLIDTPIDEVPLRSDGSQNYIVVDIKFCNMKLRVDGKFLCNEQRMPANKAQVIIYNTLLGLAQGYKPEYCYILGRAWKYLQKGTFNECLRCDERLGCIDVNGKDSFYIDKINKALNWLDRLREEGSQWNTGSLDNQPSVPELYPNMCNQYDNGCTEKKKIAQDIDEITQLWYCGVKQRERAHNQGIFQLSDTRLTTDILGFPKDTPRTKTIDKMLKFNQGIIGTNKLVIPRYIDNNPYDWQRPLSVEFFLDFEILTNIFDDFSQMPQIGSSTKVFMIGLGVSIRNNGKVQWEYYNFRVPELSDNYEFAIFDQMYEKIDEITRDNELEIGDINIYHWGSIEQTTWNRIYEKYVDRHDWEDLNLVDFNKIFIDESILVKGVWGFGLKAVGKGLINHGLIDGINWDSELQSGLDAMILANYIYSTHTITEPDEEIINDLIRYNHIDVKIIEKIINYLRINHTPGILRKITRFFSKS